MSAPFLEQALEEVVDIVMLYGEYPQPPRGGFSHRGTRKFDLVDFLRDNPAVLDPDDALGFFVHALTDYSGGFDEARHRWEKRITEAVTAKLKDSEIVRERADELQAEVEDETA